jgi:hypothetical protein
MSTTPLPSFLAPFFWSYHLADLDTRTHQTLIIKQILNHGSKEALDWLFSIYTQVEIKEAITASMVSEWSEKSLSLWSKVFGVQPARIGRFA